MSGPELLRKAAEALDEGLDPFSRGFLVEHDVTFEQCMELSDQMALGARMVARALEEPASEEGKALFRTLAREPVQP